MVRNNEVHPQSLQPFHLRARRNGPHKHRHPKAVCLLNHRSLGAGIVHPDPRVTLGASPRGALALLKLARAEAALRGREFVLPDDVKATAGAALAHRLVLRPELWVSRITPAQVVESLLHQVPAPVTDPS